MHLWLLTTTFWYSKKRYTKDLIISHSLEPKRSQGHIQLISDDDKFKPSVALVTVTAND